MDNAGFESLLAPPIFGVTEMKKSERWQEAVYATCPHCQYGGYHCGVGDEGDILQCDVCSKQFQLGEQR